MSYGEKKGITVKIDADLHAEVSQFLKEKNMTMTEFVALALDDELHPKITAKEYENMANTRTIAFQVPEELFQKIKGYLQRNGMTQRQFFLGLIENALEREQTEREAAVEAQRDETDESERYGEFDEIDEPLDDLNGDGEEGTENDEETESDGFTMTM